MSILLELNILTTTVSFPTGFFSEFSHIQLHYHLPLESWAELSQIPGCPSRSWRTSRPSMMMSTSEKPQSLSGGVDSHCHFLSGTWCTGGSCPGLRQNTGQFLTFILGFMEKKRTVLTICVTSVTFFFNLSTGILIKKANERKEFN